MRIVIVGGGISGLACYLFLRKHLPSVVPAGVEVGITILESHAATRREQRSSSANDDSKGPVSDTIGAALGLAPNGLSVLRDLGEAIFAQVANSGYPVSHFQLKSAHDRRMVSRVSYTRDQRPFIEFDDGPPGLEADLVVGADGAKSTVKSITGNGKIDEHPAVFDGLVGVGGFIPSSYLSDKEPRGRMTVTFGSHGFFGYGASTIAPQSNHFAECTVPMGDEAVWWSTYESKDLPDTRNFDTEDVGRQLKERHARWKDPVVQKVVDEAVVDSIYPTWITPDLPTWHARGLVLIRDAAHAMQPSSGQGASQGLEDAQILSLFLAHYLEGHFSQAAFRAENGNPATISEAVDQASKKYFEMRQPRVKKITDRAKQMGDMKRKKGLFEEWLTYLILWIIGKLPVDTYTRQIFNDLPVNEARKIIENDKTPPAKLPSFRPLFS